MSFWHLPLHLISQFFRGFSAHSLLPPSLAVRFLSGTPRAVLGLSGQGEPVDPFCPPSPAACGGQGGLYIPIRPSVYYEYSSHVWTTGSSLAVFSIIF